MFVFHEIPGWFKNSSLDDFVIRTRPEIHDALRIVEIKVAIAYEKYLRLVPSTYQSARRFAWLCPKCDIDMCVTLHYADHTKFSLDARGTDEKGAWRATAEAVSEDAKKARLPEERSWREAVHASMTSIAAEM